MKLILVGKAGSGKTHLKNRLIERGMKPEVSYTTRPQREGEIHGKDYFFVDSVDFAIYVDRGVFYEVASFNGWRYGTSVYQWNNCDLFIMTPSGVAQIKPEDRKDCLVMFLDIPLAVREARLKERNMPGDSIERRLAADEVDFKDFTDFDIRITNCDF